MQRYEILNRATATRNKFPYNIVRSVDPNIELTHKKVALEYNGFYYADSQNRGANKYEKKAGASREMLVFYF